MEPRKAVTSEAASVSGNQSFYSGIGVWRVLGMNPSQQTLQSWGNTRPFVTDYEKLGKYEIWFQGVSPEVEGQFAVMSNFSKVQEGKVNPETGKAETYYTFIDKYGRTKFGAFPSEIKGEEALKKMLADAKEGEADKEPWTMFKGSTEKEARELMVSMTDPATFDVASAKACMKSTEELAIIALVRALYNFDYFASKDEDITSGSAVVKETKSGKVCAVPMDYVKDFPYKAKDLTAVDPKAFNSVFKSAKNNYVAALTLVEPRRSAKGFINVNLVICPEFFKSVTAKADDKGNMTFNKPKTDYELGKIQSQLNEGKFRVQGKLTTGDLKEGKVLFSLSPKGRIYTLAELEELLPKDGATAKPKDDAESTDNPFSGLDGDDLPF